MTDEFKTISKDQEARAKASDIALENKYKAHYKEAAERPKELKKIRGIEAEIQVVQESYNQFHKKIAPYIKERKDKADTEMKWKKDIEKRLEDKKEACFQTDPEGKKKKLFASTRIPNETISKALKDHIDHLEKIAH